MIIKVGNDFLEFDDDIEVERQVKLFEDVSAIEGDFSYSFEIPKTQHNVATLELYTADNASKPWMFKIPASLLSNDGNENYIGYIRIEKNGETDKAYQASFFSGNSNWFDILNLPLRNSFTWKQYDTDYTLNNIRESWNSLYRGAITFPLLDRGALSTRGSASFWLEDFHPFVFVKDVVQTIVNQSGIKITGDILKDPRYTAMITSNNGRSGIEQRIEDRSVKVGKTVPQTATGATYSKVTFDNFSGIFYNSTNLNWDASQNRYIVDSDLSEWQINLLFNMDRKSWYNLQIRVNGLTVATKTFRNVSQLTYTRTFDTTIFAGSYIEVWFGMMAGIFASGNILTSSYLIVEPIKFRKVYVDQLLPDQTASEFLANIFRLLNMLVTYNPKSQEIKTTSFQSIAQKPEIDISQYVTVIEDDYEDFVSNYAKRNFLVWQDQTNIDTDEYNESNIIPFGGGAIDIENDFLEDEADIVELDFVAAFQKNYDFMAASFPNLKYVEVVTTDETDSFSSVSDHGDGRARFNNINVISDADILVRISDSTVEEYNGDYRIEIINTGSNYAVLQDLIYIGTATGTMTVLDWEDQNNDEQVLLLASPVNTPLIDFTGTDQAWLEFGVPLVNGEFSNTVAGYLFPNKNLRGSLVFQDNIETDWGLTSRMLNSGVKTLVSANLPAKIYGDIDFLSPLRIKTAKVNSIFYPNRITGYNDEKTECDIELVKLI